MVYSCGLLSRRQRVRVPPSPQNLIICMKKKDLRAGMRIVTQSGHSYVFMKGVVNQIVDAFIRCKIFKNPEGYNYAVTR